MNDLYEWKSAEDSFTVRLPIQIVEKLDHLCDLHVENETGGILVGQYSPDSRIATISEAYPPPNDSSFGNWWFVRGTIGLAVELIRLWKSKNRQYYVGEWHYHPSQDITLSGADIKQMFSIACSKAYKCSNPMLLIIGANVPDSKRPISITIFSPAYDLISLTTSSYDTKMI